MSSDRPARRPWSLRARLVTEQIVLLAMVCLVIGVVTVLSLRVFLLRQIDEELRDTGQPAGISVDLLPPPGAREIQAAPGQRPGTLMASRNSFGLWQNVLVIDRTGKPQRVTGAEGVLSAIPADAEPRERELGPLGAYRVMAVPGPKGGVVVTGLPMKPATDTLMTIVWVLAGVSLVGLTVAGVAGALIVRRTLTPLDRMADTARRVTKLTLHEGEVRLPDRVPRADTDPRTEVGQVGAALNRMLDHVGAALAARHRSETRVRQFVADASHELRTPLAAIRGYAELARRHLGEVPPEVAHALKRVDSEAGRMTTLVEDLLLLARLDTGRPLLFQPMDLTSLVVDAVSDAQVAGPKHHWRLDLPATPLRIFGDRLRLYQVLANLLANGRTHTPPGTTVTAGLRREGEEVVLTVTDDGPGIPEELQPEVFERFARGDTSRSRAAGSTGLGLAIVAAVVNAHHGVVEVDSAPGRTRFTVRFKEWPADPEE